MLLPVHTSLIYNDLIKAEGYKWTRDASFLSPLERTVKMSHRMTWFSWIHAIFCWFDRKVMHDGCQNTCTFSKGGKKITLVTLSPSQLHKSKPQKNREHLDLFSTCSEPLLKASYHEFRDFKEWILAIQDESRGPPLSHPLAILILKHFNHVFLDNKTTIKYR